MNRSVRALSFAAALFSLSGCASQVRSRAVSLASAGATAARTAGDSIRETASAVDRYVEAQYLLAPLTGRPEPRTETIDVLRKVRGALAARAEVMSALATAYGALEAHASFDAAGQVEKGVNGLSGAVSAYRQAVGEPPVAATSAWSFSKGLGLIAGAKQASQLRAASAEIRASLEKFVELLRREKEVLASVRRVLVDGQGAAARSLASLGLGRPGAILSSHAAAFGLTWDEKEYDGALSLLRKEPSISGKSGTTREDDLRLALDRVLEYRVERRAELEAALLDETLAGLDALVLAHRTFEAKQEADLAAVTDYVASMRALLDEYRTASGK